MASVEEAALGSQFNQWNPSKDNPSTGLVENGEETYWGDFVGRKESYGFLIKRKRPKVELRVQTV